LLNGKRSRSSNFHASKSGGAATFTPALVDRDLERRVIVIQPEREYPDANDACFPVLCRAGLDRLRKWKRRSRRIGGPTGFTGAAGTDPAGTHPAGTDSAQPAPAARSDPAASAG
jgi:hypothetical protein